MATNLLTTGTTAAASADLPLEDGERTTLALKGDADGALVFIQIKDDAGAYQDIIQLSRSPVVIDGPGTYRVRRLAGPAAGVFSD